MEKNLELTPLEHCLFELDVEVSAALVALRSRQADAKNVLDRLKGAIIERYDEACEAAYLQHNAPPEEYKLNDVARRLGEQRGEL